MTAGSWMVLGRSGPVGRSLSLPEAEALASVSGGLAVPELGTGEVEGVGHGPESWHFVRCADITCSVEVYATSPEKALWLYELWLRTGAVEVDWLRRLAPEA